MAQRTNVVLSNRSWLLAFLLLTTLGYAQDRLVLPGQELLYPNLMDPSFNGKQRRTQITAVGQFVDFNSDRATQYVNAQLPLYDNLSFGVDYFNNTFDYLNYSQVLLSAAFEVPVGTNGGIRIGLSGGGDSFRTNRVPLAQQSPDLIPNINDNNISFTYRAGLNYSNRNLTIGGYYTSLPVQNVTGQLGQQDLLSYELSTGFTGYLGYRIPLGDHFAVSPMVRYLSFKDNAIYEGSVKLQLKDILELTLAYRNDYSFNPAMRVHFFKSLALGYSYEKALGGLVFDDIHSLSLSYQFQKAKAYEEPEWMETAKENIAKIDAVKKKKPKQKEKRQPKVIKENIQNENPVLTPVEKPEHNEQRPEVADDPKQEIEAVLAAEEKVDIPVHRAVVISMAPRYYLVAKEFTAYQDAFLYKENLQENGLNALIGSTETDVKFYVYIDSDFDEATAERRLQDFKKNALLKGLYLLEVE
ncbi:PorP/SprF family type IX secretion system membrane protein [Maribacter sp. 2307ULW6-5]|uniref:PorP/SprF family type IX secretion system membrane protein n=1 Tax=Maribacter sp. 2307ULW6-5 TaxID=3386275 RepID=UPI0039BD87A8